MKKLCIIPLLALCGCMNLSVPKTTIGGTIGSQPFTLSSPKDSKLQGLQIEVVGMDKFGGTNYTKLSIQSLEASMNPAVITTTADAQVKMLNAASEAALKGAAAAGAKLVAPVP